MEITEENLKLNFSEKIKISQNIYLIEALQDYCNYNSPNINHILIDKEAIIFFTKRYSAGDEINGYSKFKFNKDIIEISNYEKEYIRKG